MNIKAQNIIYNFILDDQLSVKYMFIYHLTNEC